MSVIATPVKQTEAVRSADAVYLVDINTGLPAGGSGGATPVAGADGTNVATQINPFPVSEAQGVIASGSVALTAATAATIIGAFADRRKFRVLNYIQAPVYLAYGTTGTPASGAGSDYIPAAKTVDTFLVPGQWEAWILPVGGMRAVCAVAGSLTVTAA